MQPSRVCFRAEQMRQVCSPKQQGKANSVVKYIQSTKGRLELHFLPPYAPDLNPDEFAWNHLKQNGTSKKPLRQNEALRERIDKDLAAIKKNRRLVRSFFRA